MSYDNLHNGSTTVPNQTQWRIKAENLLVDVDIWHTTSTKRFPLGAIAESREGDLWRYCRNGGVALTKALMNQSSVQVDNWFDEPQTAGSGAVAAAIGDKSITLLVQTAPTADQWVGGYLVVTNGDGEAEMYRVKEHSLTTNPVVQIADVGGFRVATSIVSTETDISIVMNKWRDTLVAATNQTNVMVGVNHIAVPINYFYWAKTKGPAALFQDANDTPVIGDYCCQSDAVAGRAATLAAIADDIVYGTVMSAAATSETLLVDLALE